MQENKGSGINIGILIKLLIVLAVLSILGGGIVTFKDRFSTDSKTTKLGFEDIGELATQEAYCTNVATIKDARQLFGKDIPFTQSEYIYSYDVIIKAGIDFGAVKWSVDGNTINVVLPEVKVLSNEVQEDSFKVYHESESMFNNVSMEKRNESLQELKNQAKTDAITNGLLENARTNAEAVITGFINNVYDAEKYSINFSDK